MFSANILKNRNTPFFKKTEPKKTTNGKWPSRYPPSDTPKQLAIFVPNLLSSCISWAVYPDTKPVRLSSDLRYQPLTKPCWLHVTGPQVLPGGWPCLCPGEPGRLFSTLPHHHSPRSGRQLLSPSSLQRLQFPLKVTYCGWRKSSNFSGGDVLLIWRKAFNGITTSSKRTTPEREQNPGLCSPTLDGSGGLAPHTISETAVTSLFLQHHYFWW